MDSVLIIQLQSGIPNVEDLAMQQISSNDDIRKLVQHSKIPLHIRLKLVQKYKPDSIFDVMKLMTALSDMVLLKQLFIKAKEVEGMNSNEFADYLIERDHLWLLEGDVGAIVKRILTNSTIGTRLQMNKAFSVEFVLEWLKENRIDALNEAVQLQCAMLLLENNKITEALCLCVESYSVLLCEEVVSRIQITQKDRHNLYFILLTMILNNFIKYPSIIERILMIYGQLEVDREIVNISYLPLFHVKQLDKMPKTSSSSLVLESYETIISNKLKIFQSNMNSSSVLKEYRLLLAVNDFQQTKNHGFLQVIVQETTNFYSQTIFEFILTQNNLNPLFLYSELLPSLSEVDSFISSVIQQYLVHLLYKSTNFVNVQIQLLYSLSLCKHSFTSLNQQLKKILNTCKAGELIKVALWLNEDELQLPLLMKLFLDFPQCQKILIDRYLRNHPIEVVLNFLQPHLASLDPEIHQTLLQPSEREDDSEDDVEHVEESEDKDTLFSLLIESMDLECENAKIIDFCCRLLGLEANTVGPELEQVVLEEFLIRVIYSCLDDAQRLQLLIKLDKEKFKRVFQSTRGRLSNWRETIFDQIFKANNHMWFDCFN